MEFKGTQGPWTFDETDFKVKGTGDVEGKTVIANLSPRMDYSRGKTTQYANGKLISAAPDMLKLLQYLDRKGGLGLDTHKMIEETISKAI